MPQPRSQASPVPRGGLRSRDFERVYRRPERRQESQRFLVVARPNGLGRARWGLSVSARLGGAVVRNRIKRRVREILRSAERRLPAGWDVVVQPRTTDVAAAEFAALSRELIRLLERTLPAREGA